MRGRKVEAAREGRSMADRLDRFAKQMRTEGRAMFADDLRQTADHMRIMANMLDSRD